MDPKAEATIGLSPFGFANDNPISFNDPFGDLTQAQFSQIINTLLGTPYGGTWSADDGGSSSGSGGASGFAGGSNIWGYGNSFTANFFGSLSKSGQSYSFGTDGNLRLNGLFVTSVAQVKDGGINISGYYENRGAAGSGSHNLSEVVFGNQRFSKAAFWNAGGAVSLSGNGDGGMKGDNDTRMPDYLSLNLSIALPNSLTGTLIGLNGTVSLDRYGSFHISPLGISIAKSASYFSGSLTGNWLMQSSTPSQEQLSNFLTEHAFNLGGGFIIGGGVSYTPGSGGAYGVGLYSPQFGASYNYTPTSSFYNPTSNFKW